MKKSFSKKMASLVLAFAVAFTAVFASATTVQAAEIKVLYSSSELETGYANVEKKFPFTVSKSGTVYFDVTAVPTTVKLALYNSAGTLVSDSGIGIPYTVFVNDSNWAVVSYGYRYYS